jgi:putative intracellular protease/amidase
MTSVLMVLSAADHWTLNDGSSHPTGVWAEELVEPHRQFRDAGFEITIATPGAVAPTFDPTSLSAAGAGGDDKVSELTDYLASISSALASPASLDSVSAADFDVVFYPGGHGPMEDLAVDAQSGRILTDALASGNPLAVLCHAPAALLAAVGADGVWPFAGYRMTGFSNEEERLSGLADKAPWLVQDRLVELGAEFSSGDAFQPHSIIDRNLYTGQNPASSSELATAVIAAAAGK